jgi:hypothetical protein
MIRPRKEATPDRWRAALRRAKAEGLSVYRIAGTGESVVTSGRLGDTVYATDGVECECEAAVLGGDPVCKHRALFWHDRGELEDIEALSAADLRPYQFGKPADRRPIAA